MNITPVGPGKDTYGTLGPLRREAVGGPNTAPKGEVTRHDASRKHDKTLVFRQTECQGGEKFKQAQTSDRSDHDTPKGSQMMSPRLL